MSVTVQLSMSVNVFDVALLASTAERLAMLSGMTADEWQTMRADHPSGVSAIEADLLECLIGNGSDTPHPCDAGYEI